MSAAIMKKCRRAAMSIALLLVFAAPAQAQDNEYLMEIGGGVGMMGYLGDFNGSLTSNLQPCAAVVLRRLFNPYMGLKVKAMGGKLKGSSKDVATYYPDYQDTPYEFSNTAVDLGVTFEYNFWAYGTGRDYRGARPLAPYLFIGLGATYAKTSDKSVFTGNLPLGFGIKYKVAPRLNLGVEWGIHFSLSDKLDGVKDPYHVESTGLFKNTDCYHALQVSLTYSFMAKCRTCHNEDE